MGRLKYLLLGKLDEICSHLEVGPFGASQQDLLVMSIEHLNLLVAGLVDEEVAQET